MVEMIDAIGWIVTTLSIVGVVANIYKKQWCFYIWTVTNFAWMVIDYQAGIVSQSALHLIYFGLAVFGIIKWRKNE